MSEEQSLVQFIVVFYKPGNEILCNGYPFDDDDELLNCDNEDPVDYRLEVSTEPLGSVFKNIYKVIESFESVTPIKYIGENTDCGSALEMIVDNMGVYEVFQEWIKDIIKMAEPKTKDLKHSLKVKDSLLDVLDVSETPKDPKIPLAINVITMWNYKCYMSQGCYDDYPEYEDEWDLLGEVNLNEIKKTLGEKK